MSDRIFKVKPDKTAPVEKVKDYTIHGQTNIMQRLRMLQKGRRIITAYFDQGRQSLMTAIVDVLPEKNLLILDYGPNDEVNRQLIASNKVIFKSSLNGVTAQFSTRELRTATYHQQTVFACPVPDQLLWIQRRDTYRVRTQFNPLIAITLNFGHGKQRRYQVLDISAGGLSIEDHSMNEDFALGTLFPASLLELGEFGEGKVTMEVRGHIPMKRHEGDEGRRIGFMFHKLPNELDARIQRFIYSVDAQRKKTLEAANEE